MVDDFILLLNHSSQNHRMLQERMIISRHAIRVGHYGLDIALLGSVDFVELPALENEPNGGPLCDE